MPYPVIDPVIFALGPLALRWYGLMYVLAFGFAWWYGRRRARASAHWHESEVDDLVFYGALGAILGGRIGYVLFYQPQRLLEDPMFLVRIWDGGMAFHGGLLGVAVAVAYLAMRTGRTFFQVTDFGAPLVPLGLGFGRIGNFINTELPGRVASVPWGLDYPCSAVRDLNPACSGYWEGVTRHPSSLYQAFTEGLVLFGLMYLVARRPRPEMTVTGAFLVGYGVLRFSTEFFRTPDWDIGFVALGWMSMGQLLSLPMIVGGALLIGWGRLRAGSPAAG